MLWTKVTSALEGFRFFFSYKCSPNLALLTVFLIYLGCLASKLLESKVNNGVEKKKENKSCQWEVFHKSTCSSPVGHCLDQDIEGQGQEV